MNKINKFIESNVILSKYYKKGFFNSSFTIGNIVFSPVNNNILLKDEFIKLLLKENIELCFRDYIDIESIEKLIKVFSINSLFLIDKKIVDYIDFSPFIEKVFESKVTIRRKIIKNNSNNYEFLRKMFSYNKNAPGYDNSVVKAKKDIVKTIGSDNLIIDENLLKIIFLHAPYILLDYEKYYPNMFDKVNLKSLFALIDFQNQLTLNFSNYISVYVHFDEFGIVEKELEKNYKDYSKIVYSSDYIVDLNKNYKPYMDKTINLLEKYNYVIMYSMFYIFKNITKYYKLIDNFQEYIKKVNINSLFEISLSEDDLLFYYSKKKWSTVSLDTFISQAIANNYQKLYITLLKDIFNQTKKFTKTNIKYFVNNIVDRIKDDELIKFLLVNTDDCTLLYKVISKLPNSIKCDQNYITLLYKNKPEYNYYYFDNIYLALTNIYSNSIFCYDYLVDCENDLELYYALCQTKVFSHFGYRYFDNGLCDDYINKIDELSKKDLKKLSYCTNPKTNSYVVLVQRKENIIKILSAALKYKLDMKFMFPYYKYENYKDIIDILHESKWPFLYKDVPFIEYNQFNLLMSRRVDMTNHRLEILNQLVLNMIEYDHDDFINKINNDFYFPYLYNTSNYFDYKDVFYTNAYREYRKKTDNQ